MSRRGAEAEATQRRVSVLRYWRAVEAFTPGPVGRVDHGRGRPADRRGEGMYRASAGEPLPWQPGHRVARERLDPPLTWQHLVHGGVFGLDLLYERLEKVFGPSGFDVDERVPRGDTALFTVRVDAAGRPDLTSLVLSTAAWGLARAERRGPGDPHWPDGFEDDATRHRDLVASLVAGPLELDDLRRMISATARLIGLSGPIDHWEVRILSRRVPVRRDDRATDAEDAVLTSAHLDDLDRVARAVAAGDGGPALAALLTEDDALDVGARRDVRHDDVLPWVRSALSPEHVPAGRWPTGAARAPAAGQQLAVGQALAQLSDGAGILAVHAPPGTGGTTVLRDLIAAVVVARADRLAALHHPDAAFTGTVTWDVDGHPHPVPVLAPDLTGFELVLASEPDGPVDGTAGDGDARLPEAPAGVFVDLGTPAGRQRFARQLGPGDPAGTPVDWTAAVAAYRRAVSAEEGLRAERRRLARLLADRVGLAGAVPVSRAALRAALADRDAAQDDAERAARAARAGATREQEAGTRHAAHQATRPGSVEAVLTWGKAARRWHAEDGPLAADLADAALRAREAEDVARRAEAVLVAARGRVATAVQGVEDATRRLAEADGTLARAAAGWGETFPDEAWWDDVRRRELSGPWLDEAWNAARSEVFLAALALHAAFVTATAATLARSLDPVRRILAGQAPPDLAAPVALAAWQGLFLVVPVVSTTFASVPVLFSQLSREALGWLLVDDAGRARPQAAAGAIWRSRRVVAVGDPRQLEPAITVPDSTQQALRRHHQVSPTWVPAGTSVQSLADRLTDVGTRLPGDGRDPVWVGVPLRVHRRCDEPMFSLVNEMFYDGLMVHATPPREHPLQAVPTRWVDVTGTPGGGDWVPQEGDAVDQILDYLMRHEGLHPEQVAVVSPFRAVVTGLTSRLRARPGIAVSTVHRMPGRERDVVILVLGSDPARSAARDWAAQGPNLLNVAVSRAAQRLYVVGDRDLWSAQPYFGLLARRLDHRTVRPASTAG